MGDWLYWNSKQTQKSRGGRVEDQKLYTPARRAQQNPYPRWHRFSKSLPIVAQNLGWTPKKVPKSGLLVQLSVQSTENPAHLVQCWHFEFSLAQKLEKPYRLWHTFGVQNPTLTGTFLENTTLCGTEIGQNGTLAVLAYAYCRQWECPPGPKIQQHSNILWKPSTATPFLDSHSILYSKFTFSFTTYFIFSLYFKR